MLQYKIIFMNARCGVGRLQYIWCKMYKKTIIAILFCTKAHQPCMTTYNTKAIKKMVYSLIEHDVLPFYSSWETWYITISFYLV